jgi:ABC-type polysaccharide/polyol phosphate transport system ATPase subunit
VSAIISVVNATKVYRRRRQRAWLLQEFYRSATRTAPARTEHWALRDVSFEVQRGASLGIVGHNGAGKSTLLKAICGITQLTRGSATVRGRLSTQLGVGLGFNPLLTGRENLFLEGTILGLTNADVRLRLSSMIDYADIDGAVDQPVWTYSTGMVARLGFAVAAHTDFDILLLDEALSAGDARFRERCDQTLLRFRAEGRTMVIVSHGMESVRKLCDDALWLQEGRVRSIGDALSVVGEYESAMVGDAVPLAAPVTR